MVILIAIIGIVILAAGILSYSFFRRKLYNSDNEWVYYLLNSVGTILCAVALISALIIGIKLSNRTVIDDKIGLYRAENEKIEQQISVAIDGYKGYESETLEKFKTENPTTIVSLYPELKSDALISKQLELYMKNNEDIKALECEKLSYTPLAWWLYFGD